MEYQGRVFADPKHEALATYAVRFAHPVLIKGQGKTNNGTGFLLSLNGRTLGVTCQHVVEAYRTSTMPTEFHFGAAQLDPLRALVDESQELDLAVLDLSDQIGRPGGLSAASCIHPPAWPPSPLQEDDLLALAGFPGVGREDYEDNYHRLYAFSSGTTEIASLQPAYLYTRIEIDRSLVAGERPSVSSNLGGLSGGPVFAWRKGTFVTAELIGMIVEYQAAFDLLFVRRLNCLRADGTLNADNQQAG